MIYKETEVFSTNMDTHYQEEIRMNFYETPAGQMFFEHQMPQIIKSLQSLSEALNRKNPVVKLPLAEGSDILKELYLGKLMIF